MLSHHIAHSSNPKTCIAHIMGNESPEPDIGPDSISFDLRMNSQNSRKQTSMMGFEKKPITLQSTLVILLNYHICVMLNITYPYLRRRKTDFIQTIAVKMAAATAQWHNEIACTRLSPNTIKTVARLSRPTPSGINCTNYERAQALS